MKEKIGNKTRLVQPTARANDAECQQVFLSKAMDILNEHADPWRVSGSLEHFARKLLKEAELFAQKKPGL